MLNRHDVFFLLQSDLVRSVSVELLHENDIELGWVVLFEVFIDSDWIFLNYKTQRKNIKVFKSLDSVKKLLLSFDIYEFRVSYAR
jgi:hypothetical protein